MCRLAPHTVPRRYHHLQQWPGLLFFNMHPPTYSSCFIKAVRGAGETVLSAPAGISVCLRRLWLGDPLTGVGLNGRADQWRGCAPGRKLRWAAVSIRFTAAPLSRGHWLGRSVDNNSSISTQSTPFCSCIVMSATTRNTAQDIRRWARNENTTGEQGLFSTGGINCPLSLMQLTVFVFTSPRLSCLDLASGD